jgi:hypothetical protein
MKIVNLTPHVVRLNDGTEYQPSGMVARVSSLYSDMDENRCYRAFFGDVTGVPPASFGTLYVVSGLVSAGTPDRPDVVAPATGHPLAVRKDGQVYSVPGFVK